VQLEPEEQEASPPMVQLGRGGKVVVGVNWAEGVAMGELLMLCEEVARAKVEKRSRVEGCIVSDDIASKNAGTIGIKRIP